MKAFTLQLLILSLVVSLAQPAIAQRAGKKVSFGLKIGANFTKLDELSYQAPRLDMAGLPVMSGGNVVYDFFQQNDSRSTGLVGGLYARFGNRIFIQPEVLLSVKGGKIDLVRQGLATQSIDLKRATIDVPVLLGIRLGRLRLNAGPLASLTVLDSGNLKETLEHYSSQSLKLTTQQAQWGYQAGVGLSFSGMQFDLRREGSLGDLSGQSSPTSNQLPTRANLWQLTVGFGF